MLFAQKLLFVFGLIILMLLALGKNLARAGPLSVLPTHAPFFFLGMQFIMHPRSWEQMLFYLIISLC